MQQAVPLPAALGGLPSVADLVLSWTGALKTQVRLRLLEGIRSGGCSATWEKYFSIPGVDVAIFVRLMQNLEGVLRLAETQGREPGKVKLRYVMREYSAIKKFCNFFELVKWGVASDKDGRWVDNLRLNSSGDYLGCLGPLVFTLYVKDFGNGLRLTALIVSYCIATIPYTSMGSQVTLATDVPVDWEEWSIPPPFAEILPPRDVMEEEVLQHLLDIHAGQQQQPLPPGDDELHYLRVTDAVAEGAKGRLGELEADRQQLQGESELSHAVVAVAAPAAMLLHQVVRASSHMLMPPLLLLLLLPCCCTRCWTHCTCGDSRTGCCDGAAVCVCHDALAA